MEYRATIEALTDETAQQRGRFRWGELSFAARPLYNVRQDNTAPNIMPNMLTINLETARRFILGKQGLWPGRRWRGIKGTEQAMRAMEYLQLDPLQIIARSQDIKLHSRVLDYTPGLWEEAGLPAAQVL